ncbi:hypothetical protein ACFTQ7_04275 [Lysinibacillus sp. NPDC056959]|uniref:hypothetical protein n=1 Tax=Lysinibacillus sp. NPDC056959 TaxID=3345981 RepID=UPI00362B75C9
MKKIISGLLVLLLLVNIAIPTNSLAASNYSKNENLIGLRTFEVQVLSPLSRQCKKDYNYSQLHVLFGGDFSISITNKISLTSYNF